MTLASRLRCKNTARISNYQDFLQKNRRKILDSAILLYRLRKSHPYSPFSHHPTETRYCPFLSPLMAFGEISCYHRTLRPLKCSTIGSCSPPIFPFPRNFLKKRGRFLKKRGRFSEKRWTFSKKRGSFFQPSPRKDFSQQIETQKSRKWKSCKIRSSTFNCENRQLSSMDTQL